MSKLEFFSSLKTPPSTSISLYYFVPYVLCSEQFVPLLVSYYNLNLSFNNRLDLKGIGNRCVTIYKCGGIKYDHYLLKLDLYEWCDNDFE